MRSVEIQTDQQLRQRLQGNTLFFPPCVYLEGPPRVMRGNIVVGTQACDDTLNGVQKLPDRR